MVWSYSSSRTFQRCQKQWFIKQHYVSARAKKDPRRRQAYLYSTLQSLPAWRGSLVDTIITKNFVLPIDRGSKLPSKNHLLKAAWRLFKHQLQFAKRNRAWEEDMTRKKAGDDFASLFPVVYGGDMSDEAIDQMWSDIEQSLINFRESDELMSMILDGSKLAAQRPLTFTLDDTNVKMIPDLIVFYDKAPPLIIDWKVQQTGYHNARRQLASYALALANCKPHKDFPDSFEVDAVNIRLLEMQLLTNQQRFYSLSQADIEASIAYISQTQDDINLATENSPKSLTFDNFPSTNDPSVCERCNFQKICWEQN
ncbi:MAG: PD-(D/E)XK nuclease family protein [Chloroflexota bacterium]